MTSLHLHIAQRLFVCLGLCDLRAILNYDMFGNMGFELGLDPGSCISQICVTLANVSLPRIFRNWPWV